MYIEVFFSWVFPTSIFIYLVTLHRLVGKLRREQKNYWNELGSPRLSDTNDQVVILQTVLIGRKMPASIASKYKMDLAVVRISFIVAFLSFVVVAILMLTGAYE